MTIHFFGGLLVANYATTLYPFLCIGTLRSTCTVLCAALNTFSIPTDRYSQVAAGRILNVLNADALVTVVSPSDGLNDEVRHRIDKKEVTYFDRVFQPSDLDMHPWALVMTAIDDPVASSEIWKLCKEKRLNANIADVPPECDFYFGSVHRDGPLQIMVSTNGKGPRIAAMVRKQIASSLPPNLGEAIEKVGMLRRKLRGVAPGSEEGPKRMKWMISVCDEYSLENFIEMNENDMDLLLKSYAPGTVPKYEDVRLGQDPDVPWVFDGSFGWSL